MKFVILTDTHFVEPGRLLYGLDPAARLAAAVHVINRDHADIAFAIVTGDLAHWGEIAAYAELKRVMGGLAAPVILMMGNHDRREPLRAVFADADDDGNGYVQSVRRFEAATVITLDTADEESRTHAGFLCPARLAFFDRALAEAPPDRPVLLFQHHPPFDTGLPHLDRIRLRNPEALWAVFERRRRPDHIFLGHVHRPIAGTWRGVPFHIQRATNHQVAFDLVSEEIPGSLEMPDYSLVSVAKDAIVIHQRPFLYDGPVYWLHDKAAQDAPSTAALAG
ncbi:MAG: phosphodiesterase [Rhodospirillales bacterium]|nr:phosphodiesterase [Rhodospirillales bacterium]